MVYRLGDPIRVRLVAVSLDERKIDFVPVQSTPQGAGGRKRRR
jgi:ribonuclease R